MLLHTPMLFYSNICLLYYSFSFQVFAALRTMDVKTVKEENLLAMNDEEKGIVIFSFKTNLEQLCKTKIILMDGTFEYCTKHFTQLFTIHSYAYNQYVPLVFCLLQDKKKRSYTEAMDATRKVLLNTDCNFIQNVQWLTLKKPFTVVWDLRFHRHQTRWK